MWMATIFVLSSIPSLKSPLEPFYDFLLRKLAHVGEYAVLSGLLFRALTASGFKTKRALATAALVSLFYAATDEWHQTFVPGREGTLRDVGVDALGVVGARFMFQKRRVSPAGS